MGATTQSRAHTLQAPVPEVPASGLGQQDGFVAVWGVWSGDGLGQDLTRHLNNQELYV